MNEWLTRRAARLIRASVGVDRAFAKIYQVFSRARSELVLLVASDPLLDQYNELAYGGWELFRTDSDRFCRHLFPWEEEVVAAMFPPPPARILIGGAGGGREAFALAQKGYEVTAFEPCTALVEMMAAHGQEGGRVDSYQAAYEDLPLLRSVTPGLPTASLDELGPFDAAILGWCSFSHIRTEALRLQALVTMARATDGPVLVSFFGRQDTERTRSRTARLRRLLPSRYNRELGNTFTVDCGFCHQIDEVEIAGIGRQAGLKLLHVSMERNITHSPHAVFVSQPSLRTRAPRPQEAGIREPDGEKSIHGYLTPTARR